MKSIAMLVPRTRLLIWFALVVIPFATLGGVVPGAAAIALVLIAAFVLAVATDGLLASRSLRGISLELTPLLRATQDRPFSIGVSIRNPSAVARLVRPKVKLFADVERNINEAMRLLANLTQKICVQLIEKDDK